MTEIIWTHQQRKISELKPYDKNPRRISKSQYQRLVDSIKKTGYNNRLLINTDNTVAAGHQRLKALTELGYTEIDVLMPNRQLTEQEFDRVLISDNIQLGEFDMDMIANNFEIENLIDWGMEASLFPDLEPEIQVLDGEDDPVEVDDKKPAKTMLGDVYKLGNHRLMCGDSVSADNVGKLLENEKPILMVTDPPYGVNYDPEWREGRCGNGFKGISSVGKVENDHLLDWTGSYSLFPGNICYVWHSAKQEVKSELSNCGFNFISQIIWVKPNFAISRGDYHWQHELCTYSVKTNENHNWQGARDQSTIWNIKRNTDLGNVDKSDVTGHATQKPIDCMLRPILNNTKEGESVYDPFGGSGTTMIAAEKSNRKCFMMELSPHYCDVIVNRWEKLTGLKAELCGK